MNKHTKVALVVAPFLLIGGYGLMDLYLKETEEPRFMELEVEGADCNITANRCFLSSGNFELSIYNEDGDTVVNTNLAMYRVSLFTVDADGNASEYQMGMNVSDPFYWRTQMGLSEVIAANPNGVTMRIITQVENTSYAAEFVAR